MLLEAEAKEQAAIRKDDTHMIKYDSEANCIVDTREFTGPHAVTDAAIEIKGALFSMMSMAFVQLVDQTGKSPATVGEELCRVIEVKPEEFKEFITMTMGGK